MASNLSKVGAIALLVLSLGIAPAMAETQMLLLQLNKVETIGDGCQISFRVENQSDSTFDVFSVDLVFFDPDGVMSSRSTVSFGKLRPGKTNMRPFVFPALACNDLGEVLVNDVVQCQISPARDVDCIDAIAVDYKGSIALVK